MHGIEVMYQRLHGLIGGLTGFLICVFAGEAHAFGRRLRAKVLPQRGGQGLVIAVPPRQTGPFAGLAFEPFGQRRGIHLIVLICAIYFQRFRQIVAEQLAEGLLHPRRHRVVEVGNGLSAMLVILVGLNGDTGQRGI